MLRIKNIKKHTTMFPEATYKKIESELDFEESIYSTTEEKGIEIYQEVFFTNSRKKTFVITLEIHTFDSGNKYYYFKNGQTLSGDSVSKNRIFKMLSTILKNKK